MKLRVTVHGVAYEVDVEILEDDGIMTTAAPVMRPVVSAPVINSTPSASVAAPANNAPSTGNGIVAPIAGTVNKINVTVGQEIKKDDVVLIVEAMKMNTEICAESPGKVKAIKVVLGDSVREGQLLIEL